MAAFILVREAIQHFFKKPSKIDGAQVASKVLLIQGDVMSVYIDQSCA